MSERNRKPQKSGFQKRNFSDSKDRSGRPNKNNAGFNRYGGNKQKGRPAAKSFRPKPEVEGLASRRVALGVIRDVTERGSYASLSLNSRLTGAGLSSEDRRLAARLAYDTIQHVTWLDTALNQIMAKQDTDIRVRNVLRLGACQLLLEDRIPESAATNTSVALCRELDGGVLGELAGVVNGILRNLIRKKDELVWPDPEKEPLKARSVRYSVPEWLIARLDADWGETHADALLSAANREAVTIRPNLMKLDDAGFAALLEKKVWQKAPSPAPHGVRVTGMADIAQDSDFLGGMFSIQSESSMLACQAVNPQRGWQVLDACAAPGGKACHMAEMMAGTGRVYAWELHAGRTALIQAQVKRLRLDNVRPLTRDATQPRADAAGTMDAVLIDAPCSGLGNLADKPDIRLRVTEQSLAELTQTQAKLLETCSTYVKRGGVLVYTTCSILKDENERQITAFLEKHPEFTLEKLPDTIPERFRQREGIGLQLFQDCDDVSGFYMARLRRSRR